MAAFDTPNEGRHAIEDYFAKLVQAASTTAQGRGCFLVNTLMAGDYPTLKVQADARRRVDFIKCFLQKHFALAREQDEKLENSNITEAVYALFGIAVGVCALARMNASPKTIRHFTINGLR
jgi:hypothetical protein